MIDYKNFRLLKIAVADCPTLENYIAEEGGSIDCNDAATATALLTAIYNASTIRDIRRLTGLSQAAFAAAYGIPHRTLQDWERGERCATDYMLDLLHYAVLSDNKPGLSDTLRGTLTAEQKKEEKK